MTASHDDPGLRVYRSNRLEILAGELARVAAGGSSEPLAPETIVVQSRGMARWLTLQLAEVNGIAANLDFPFPDTFLRSLSARVLPETPEDTRFDLEPLTLRIMEHLPAVMRQAGGEELARYLAEDPGGLKRYQLARRVADLFDQYLVFRPQMIFAWEEGREAHWQARLWRHLTAGDKALHRARLHRRLIAALRDGKTTGRLPARVSIFGLSYLPPFYLQVLQALAACLPVYFFLMSPCREFWADIVSEKERRRIVAAYPSGKYTEADLHLAAGNRLLASLGLLGRDFSEMIAAAESESTEAFQTPGHATRLQTLQTDILTLSEKSITAGGGLPDDPSLQFHACHSPMREIEVLHDQLLAMFADDPDLEPRDVLVMTPDIETYAPIVGAVFDAHTDDRLRIPFSVADLSPRNASRLVDAFLSLLDLDGERLGNVQVLGLLENPAMAARFGLTSPDLDRIEQWVDATGIRWGVDAGSRRRLGLPELPQNTWRAGIERLLLGYAMLGETGRMFDGVLPGDPVEGDEAEVLGRFAAFLDAIAAWAADMPRARRPGAWADTFLRLAETFFLADDDAEREMQWLRDGCQQLLQAERLAGGDTEFELPVARSFLEDVLARQGSGAGFFGGGVTFCALLPMRSLPAKVICLVGMNNATYPRQDRPPAFDLMARNPRLGDRSRRRDDKYLFLEALISARRKLYISYVGQSVEDNNPIPPSVLVSELLEYLAAAAGRTPDSLVTRHRLQPFSPAYFTEKQPGCDGGLFSYSREDCAAARRLADASVLRPFFAAPLAPPEAQWYTVTPDILSAFFGNPARFLLQGRLGLFLSHETRALDEREPFDLSGLAAYAFAQQLVDVRLSGGSLDAFREAAGSLGALPHGACGQVHYDRLRGEVEAFAARVESVQQGRCAQGLPVETRLAGCDLRGEITGIFPEGLCLSRFAGTRAKDLIDTWIRHLCLLVQTDGRKRRRSLLICKDAVWRFDAPGAAADHLAGLLNLYREGLLQPLAFFAETGLAFARQVCLGGKPEADALQIAVKAWNADHTRQPWHEAHDPYIERCFAHTIAIDARFAQNALAVFEPLLAHLSKEVLETDV